MSNGGGRDDGGHRFTIELLSGSTLRIRHITPSPSGLVGGEPPDGATIEDELCSLLHVDDRERALAALEAGRAGDPVDVDVRLIGFDGRQRWLRVQGRPRLEQHGRVLLDGVVHDVTTAHAEEDAREAHAALSRIVHSIDEYLYTDEVLAGGEVISVFQSPGRELLLGLPPGAPDAAPWATYVHPDDRDLFAEAQRTARRGGRIDVEYRVIGADGLTRWVWDRARLRRDGERVLYDGIVSNVTELRELQEELHATIREMRRLNVQLERARDEAERRSRIDPVTGVANRRHFSELLASAVQDEEDVSVLLVDVDHFKQVNDAYGHTAGDDVLLQVCGRIRGAIRSADELARWGGEEFAVLVRGPLDERGLRALGEGIRSALSEEVLLTDAGPVLVTVSVGAASAGPGSATAHQLLQAADRALYAAKRRGRNQVVLASELREDDLLIAEPEVVRLAHMLAIMTATHEGMSARHPEQVADLAGRIAERLGASPAEVLRCRLAGWLHDIGTIAVPGEVLIKPGALDDAEWALVRSHPLSGQEMVASVSALADAALGVRHHHERLDGSGYPDGLRDEEIPFEARVVAVADAYSAMTWERPFRRRRSSEEALRELRAGSPDRYDQDAVEALVATIEEERRGPRRERRRVTDLA